MPSRLKTTKLKWKQHTGQFKLQSPGQYDGGQNCFHANGTPCDQILKENTQLIDLQLTEEKQAKQKSLVDRYNF